MILLNIVNFINGSLQLELSGNNIRRFINLCVSNNIQLNNIKYITETKYYCCIKSNEIFKIVPHLRKTKTHIKVLSRQGISLYMKSIKQRYYCCLFFLFLFIMLREFSSRMWDIQTVGNSYVTKSQIINELSLNGYKIGDKINKIDCKNINRILRDKFENLVWVSCSFNGTALIIMNKESPVTTNYIEETGDIIAAKDAVISSIVMRSGKAYCHKGDTVRKGDLLVACEFPITDEYEQDIGTYCSKADADIKGYVEYKYDKTYPVEDDILQKTNHHKNNIRIGLNRHYFTFPPIFNYYENEYELTNIYTINPLNILDNPICLGITTTQELKKVHQKRSFDELKKRSNDDFDDFINNLEENGVLILSKNVIMEQVDNNIHVSGSVYGCEDIVKYTEKGTN